MKKILINAILISIITIGVSVPAFAYNYDFSSGADYSDALGKPTDTDAFVVPDPMTQNVRRNKDAAFFPPSYGVFSGDIPTNATSPYHDNSPPNSGYTGSTSTGTSGVGTGAVNTAVSNPAETSGTVSAITEPADTGSNEMLPSTSIAASSSDIVKTQPLYNDNGTIGVLSIPKLNLTVDVYEGETLENMRVGVGHFAFTSAWDGNIGIAGHNRGVPAAIGRIEELVDGDEIIFSTRYGTRTYKVYVKKQIDDTDYSSLGWSDRNIITLITCVRNVPNKRWCIQAVEMSA
jgi:sortase A